MGLLCMLILLLSTPSVDFALTTPAANVQQSPYAKSTPKYAKWGRLAISETQKRYPQATIIDYLHVGRQIISESTSQEVFKLWLKDNRHEFGVFVRILFDKNTEKVLKISYQETNR